MIKKVANSYEIQFYSEFVDAFNSRLVEVNWEGETEAYTADALVDMWYKYEEDELDCDNTSKVVLNVFHKLAEMGGYYDLMEYCLENMEGEFIVSYETTRYNDNYLTILEI